MLNSKQHIIILGAGPAGIGAAYQLSKYNKAKVTVIEMNDVVGGNAGSFQLDGLYFDYGSHRLHPLCHPEILSDIKELLGDDLVERPRNGRIRLMNRWIRFPLKASELVTRLPFTFSIGVVLDMFKKALPLKHKTRENESFYSVLKNQLGKTICEEFYFPYARKIWGLDPEKISSIQAEKRVAANSFVKLFKKVFSKSGNKKFSGKPYFYYPKKGFGQISEALFEQSKKQGVKFIFNAKVKNLVTEGQIIKSIIYQRDDEDIQVEGDYVWSTLPVTFIANNLIPPADESIKVAADSIDYRSMLLIYLVLDEDHFTKFDAHYFPETDIPITRLSETKNYSGIEVKGKTGICAELPCSTEDKVWNMSEQELSNIVKSSLQKADIPITADISRIKIKKLKYAYPIYNSGYEVHYDYIDEYIKSYDNLLSFGRQGLFAHDNTHHALYMAYSAVKCLDKNGSFNKVKWMEYRKEFETHVVVD